MPLSPFISIITPTFNNLLELKNCIKSVESQDYIYKEHVIIDGGSTDGTLEYLIEQCKFSNHIIWQSEKDNGIYDAMNKGIQLSKGQYLIFLGADDVFYKKNTLSKVFENHDIINFDFIYGKVKFKNSGLLYGGPFSIELLKKMNICHQAIFYSRNVFNTLGLYGNKFKISEDYVLNIKCFQSIELSKKYIDNIISIFNDTGISSIENDEFIRYRLQYFHNKSILDHFRQAYFLVRPSWFKPSNLFLKKLKFLY